MLRLAGPWLTMVAAVSFTGCEPAVEPDGDAPASPVTVSDPTLTVSVALPTEALSASTSSSADAAYVSLSPGTVPAGNLAVIRNSATGRSVMTFMLNGGFDPVAVQAGPDNTLYIDIQAVDSSRIEQFVVAVPERRRPVIVRTHPPRGKRDVTLNSPMFLVFSEPIETITLNDSTVQLQSGSGRVPGRLEFQDPDHTKVAFIPAASLDPYTEYVLTVTQGVRDLEGDGLEQAYEVSFSTGGLVAAPSQSSILVDASRDGGVWWFPQYPAYDPGLPHQGWDFAQYLRSVGFEVDELGRGTLITDELLGGYTKVIRASSCGPYSELELQAYQHFLSRGGTLLLIGDHLGNPACAPDGLSEMLGIGFAGKVAGRVTRFADHPVTAGVRDLPYLTGSYVARHDTSTVRIVGWLDSGEPVMGIVEHPAAKIFFMGELNSLERLPEPLIDNLVEWGFCSSTCIARGDLRVSTTTAGAPVDADGYAVCVDEADPAQCIAVGPTGTLAIRRLPAGTHAVRLAGVADNCTVAEPDSLTVEISTGATTEIAFLITCGVLEDLVPYGTEGYRFKVLTDSMNSISGFEMPAFDDAAAGFLDGGAPFGTPVSAYDCLLGSTSWPPETDLLLRKAFNLPDGSGGVKVRVAIDNDVQVFVNGVDVTAAGETRGVEGGFFEGGFQRHEGCAERESFLFAVPDTLVHEGANWLAVRARDRGGDSYVDLRVTAQRR